MNKISPDKALDIARLCNSDRKLKIYSITGFLPDNCLVYNCPENCWFVLCDSDPKILGLKSSRLICVSKETGKIMYDGSANNEG